MSRGIERGRAAGSQRAYVRDINSLDRSSARFEVIESFDMSFVRSLASFYRHKQQLCAVNGRAAGAHFMSRDRGFSGMDRWRFFKDQGSKTGTLEKDHEICQQQNPPPRSPFTAWAKWILGSMLTLIIPLWEKKWSLLKIRGEMEMVADAAEVAVDAVEKVANAVEKVSSEVAERLPEDAELKGAALLVEHVAKEAARDARIAKDIIHEVDRMKQDVELILESIATPDGTKGK